MQEKKERPPILDKFGKRETPTVGRPEPNVERHRFAFTDEEPAGYDPYDKPPPVVTTARLDAPMSRRTKPRT